MPLRAFIILVFLVLGAAVNVAVAWVCQVFSRVESVELIPTPDPRVNPPARIGALGAPFVARQRAEGFGRTHYWHLMPVTSSLGPDRDLGRFQAGWPMRSLESRTGAGWRPVPSFARAWSYEFSGTGTPKWLEEHPLPLYPLWVGFTVNTLFWGGAIPPLIVLTQAARGTRRRYKGQCRWCGYPLGASPVCTECGRTTRDTSGSLSERPVANPPGKD